MTRPPESGQSERKPLRLEFLDGLRGLAALFVLLFHAFNHSIHSFPLWVVQIVQIGGDGTYAVGVFIVLSGFCLMMPVVRSSNLELKSGFTGYIGRRMRRILPPYYAALALGLIPIGLSQLPKYLHGRQNEIKAPVSIENILAHLFLVHNVNVTWASAIDGPMWSVSTEWEIYFLFALLLLPVWKFAGNIAVIISGFAIGLLPYALPCARMFGQAHFWFSGLFTIGMVSAALCFSPKYSNVYRTCGPLAGYTAMVFYAMVVIAGLLFKPYGEYMHIGVWTWAVEALVGLSAGCLIVYCCRVLSSGNIQVPAVLALLQSKLAVTLGAFSYSLYLTHEMVFKLIRP